MQTAPKVLRSRQTQPRRVRVDAREILGGHVTDQDIGHVTMISADIDALWDGRRMPVGGGAGRLFGILRVDRGVRQS